jgi:poly(A) polymerase
MDEKLSRELEARLHHEDVFEAPDECARREEVLGEINEVLCGLVAGRGYLSI